MAIDQTFTDEASLVASFIESLNRSQRRQKNWTVYPETAGWDLVLVHSTGAQVGIEAKLSLNAKVVDQALSGQHQIFGSDGPDYRAVLVPAGKVQLHLDRICAAIGIKILAHTPPQDGTFRYIDLPDPNSDYSYGHWPQWCPAQRLTLPDYIPDVAAGVASPVQLTAWKVKAIKLMICLERRGFVDRSVMRAIDISPSRWTDRCHGFLATNGNGQYVSCKATPDLRAQHPVNYAEIEADSAEWGKCLDPFKTNCPDWLLPDGRPLASAKGAP